MTDRRLSDGESFSSTNGLFRAALVLGLYIFMVPPSNFGSDSSVYELLNDVDWKIIGSMGLAYDKYKNGYVDDPSVKFIRKGGAISIAGVVHNSGYQSARRILIDFSHLLDNVSQWQIGNYNQMLWVMTKCMLSKKAECK
jgi:hypothetical protein